MALTVGKEIKKKTKSLVIRLVLLTVCLTSGAAIFSAIENDGSLNEKDVEVNLKVDEIKKNMTTRFNASENIIEQYVEDLRQLFQKHNCCGKYSHNWSYYQSLYFAGSVTTTIGKWNFYFVEGVCAHQSTINILYFFATLVVLVSFFMYKTLQNLRYFFFVSLVRAGIGYCLMVSWLFCVTSF